MKQLTDEQIIAAFNKAESETPGWRQQSLHAYKILIAEFCRINGITGEAQPAREWVGLDEVLEALDNVPCDCSHSRRYDKGEHLTCCPLFDLDIAISKLREKLADNKAGWEVAGYISEGALKDMSRGNRHANIWFTQDQYNTVPLYTHPQPQAEVRVPDGYVLVKLGFGKVEVASGNHEGVPALIFGKNGTGIIGEATQPNRMHAEGETLACVTFANAESLEVVQHHINEVRAMLAAAQKPQDDLPAILKKQAS